MVVGQLHDPAPFGRRTAHRDVPTQADQNPATRGGPRSSGHPVGAQRFGRRSQVQLHPRRNPDPGTNSIQLNCPPAGHRLRIPPERRPDRRHGRKVTVVTNDPHGLANRRVHDPAGDRRRPQRYLDGLQQQPGDRHSPASSGVDPGDLTVSSEATAGPVDRIDLSLQNPQTLIQMPWIGDDQSGVGTDGRYRRPDQGAHDPPELTTGGATTGCGAWVGGVMTGCVVGVGCVVGTVFGAWPLAPDCDVEVGCVLDTGRVLAAGCGTVPEPADGALTEAVWELLPGSARAAKADSAPPPTIAPTAKNRVARRILYKPTSRAERDNIIPSVRIRA